MNNEQTMILEQAINLNSEGVYYLSVGYNKEAARSFTRALTLLNRCSQLAGQGDEMDDSGTGGTSPKVNKSGAFWKGVSIPGLQDEAFYIHGTAMVILDDDHHGLNAKTATSDRILFVCALVLFNIALCHHKFGMNLGDRRHLGRACQFYEKCADLVIGLQQLEVAGADSHEGSPGLELTKAMTALAYLCKNNQAQIHNRLFCDPKKATEVLLSLPRLEFLEHAAGLESFLPVDVLMNFFVIPRAPILSSPAA